jgi:ABC-type transport system involved in multi-copper enzyme maturation permease subunit
MLTSLILKELRAHILTARFQAILVLQVVSLAAGFGMMTENYQSRQQASYSSREIHRRENKHAFDVMNGTEEYELHDMQGVYVARAPAPLSWAVRGLEGWLPAELHVSLRHSRSIDGDIYRNPLMSRFPAPDLLYLALYLLSLLAVVLSFDSVTGEREQGTLQLLLTQAVPRHQVLLGKWIGGFAALGIGTIIGVLVGVLFPLLTGAVAMSWPWIATVSALLVGVLLYLAVYLSMGLLVSCLVRHSSTALVVALLTWTVSTLVLPGPVRQVAAQQRPAVSKAELMARHQGIETDRERAGWALPWDKGPEWRQEQQRILEDEARGKKAAATEDYENRLRQQMSLARTASRYLPAGALTNALTTITATGVDLAFSYGAAERRLIAKLETLASEGVETGAASDLSELRLSPSVPLTARLAEASVDFAVLGIYSILLFLLANTCFLRRDII